MCWMEGRGSEENTPHLHKLRVMCWRSEFPPKTLNFNIRSRMRSASILIGFHLPTRHTWKKSTQPLMENFVFYFYFCIPVNMHDLYELFHYSFFNFKYILMGFFFLLKTAKYTHFKHFIRQKISNFNWCLETITWFYYGLPHVKGKNSQTPSKRNIYLQIIQRENILGALKYLMRQSIEVKEQAVLKGPMLGSWAEKTLKEALVQNRKAVTKSCAVFQVICLRPK